VLQHFAGANVLPLLTHASSSAMGDILRLIIFPDIFVKSFLICNVRLIWGGYD